MTSHSELLLLPSFLHPSLLLDMVLRSSTPRHCKPRRSREGSRICPFSDFVSHFQEHKLPWLPKPGLLISNICSRCQINEVVPSQRSWVPRLFQLLSLAQAITSPAACLPAAQREPSCGDSAPPWKGGRRTRDTGYFPEPALLHFPKTPIISTHITQAPSPPYRAARTYQLSFSLMHVTGNNVFESIKRIHCSYPCLVVTTQHQC